MHLWRGQLEKTIAILRDPASAKQAEAKGPSAEDVEAASTLSARDRQAMVEGMVQRLDETLRQNGGDIDGWKRLVRSYMILNRRNDAQDALARGMKALQGENRTELQSFATTLGLDVGTAQE